MEMRSVCLKCRECFLNKKKNNFDVGSDLELFFVFFFFLNFISVSSMCFCTRNIPTLFSAPTFFPFFFFFYKNKIILMYRTPPLCSLFAVPSGGCPRVIPSAQWWHYSHVTSFTNAFRLGWTRWVFSSPAIPSIIIHLILAHSSCWIPVNIVKVRSIFLLYIFFFSWKRRVAISTTVGPSEIKTACWNKKKKDEDKLLKKRWSTLCTTGVVPRRKEGETKKKGAGRVGFWILMS